MSYYNQGQPPVGVPPPQGISSFLLCFFLVFWWFGVLELKQGGLWCAIVDLDVLLC